MKLFHFHIRRRRRHNVHLFEGSVFLHVLGRSLVDVFVPVLLLQNGFSLSNVIWYYALFNAVDIPLNLFADATIRRIGGVRTVALGTVASIAFLLLLGTITPGSWTLLALLALLGALYDVWYWVGHLYLFAEAEKRNDDPATDTGMLAAVRILGGMAGPIAGAGLLLFGGGGTLVAASITVLILSLIPLFELRIPHDVPAGERVPLRKFFEGKKERRIYGSLMLYAFHDSAEIFLWPLFVFVTFGTVGSVALLAVVVSLSNAGFSYFAGRFSRFHPWSMIAIGSLCIGAVWIARTTFADPTVYYGSLVAMGFLALMTGVPIEAGVLERAKKTEELSAMTYRNAATMVPPFLLFSLLGVLTDVFRVGFIAAAASMFALSLLGVSIATNRYLPAR